MRRPALLATPGILQGLRLLLGQPQLQRKARHHVIPLGRGVALVVHQSAAQAAGDESTTLLLQLIFCLGC